MSVTRTFTVTVSDPGSGNKYFIDGVQQDTINLAETGTYVFNYPSAHPFTFSTTSDGIPFLISLAMIASYISEALSVS